MENKFDYQEYLASNLTEVIDLENVRKIEWVDVSDEYEGEYLLDLLSGIEVVHSEGYVFSMGFHDPKRSRELYEIDCIILNILAQRVFKENGVNCPYNYPLNLEYVTGLVNDARKLLRMKANGEDLAAFTFEYCLADARKGKWVNIYPWVYYEGYEDARNQEIWDDLAHYIENG